MAAVYSVCFFRAFTAVGPLQFTCPAGFVCVLRDVDVVGESNGSSDVLSIDIEGLGFIWGVQGSGGAFQTAQWRGRSVFTEGQVLEAGISGAGTWHVSASGYQLTLP